MDATKKLTDRVLLIDTCGETAGVGLCIGVEVVAQEDFVRLGASSEIVAAVKRLLEQVGWSFDELVAVGVVNGPGSFTGVRAGMAAAKGFCEALGLRMAAVSRLLVLAETAGVTEGFVALDAGRGEVFVREVATGREWLCGVEALVAVAGEQSVIVSEERLVERLGACTPQFCALHVRDAVGEVLNSLRDGECDVALVEANYGRGESDIYAKNGTRS